jgi:hypothetical protein
MSRLWGALAFAEMDLLATLTWGVVKRLPAKPKSGPHNIMLAIGYCYPNQSMMESYWISVWCCKLFATLILPKIPPFWTAKEPHLAALRAVKVIRYPLHIATNLEGYTHLLSSDTLSSKASKNMIN